MRFAGYAAVFDRVDRGGDVVRRGAFQTVLRQAQDCGGFKTIPLLWQHDRARPIGEIEMLAEDAKGLWRGRRGTEWAVATHPINAPFLLLEAISLARLSISAAVASVRVMAVGVGDVTGAVANGPAEIGASVRPLSPVSMTATPSGGDLLIGWTRRSRDGWRWRDLVDVPVGEEGERYRVTKVVTGRPDLIVETIIPTWTYASAERAADVAAGATMAAISVVQIGAFSVSKAASITVPTT